MFHHLTFLPSFAARRATLFARVLNRSLFLSAREDKGVAAASSAVVGYN